MIRAFLIYCMTRWGPAGVLVSLLLMLMLGYFVASWVWWFITAQVWILGIVNGVLCLLLLVRVIAWLRSRRRGDHLLMSGRRRRWLD